MASGELALIEQIRRRAAGGQNSTLTLGIGDDCAILRPPAGHDLLVTTDFSLEGRHFRRDWHPAESVGHRCLARGLSDLAAMGARPMAAFLSLALPPEMLAGRRGAKPWVERFFDGLLALAAANSVPLAGGDTAQSPATGNGSSGPALADITLIGSAPRGKALRRSTARPGDLLYVTGALGGAAAELVLLERNTGTFRKLTRAEAGHPHLYPQPRVAVGRALLRRKLATACIDVSDGLSTDLAHLCHESGVGAEVDAASLPLHPLAEGDLQLALHGGEDYELLFTAPATIKVPAKLAGVSITPIGRIVRLERAQPRMMLVDAQGRRMALTPRGWEHFRRAQTDTIAIKRK